MLNKKTAPKPVKSEPTAAKLSSVTSERLSFGVLIMYLKQFVKISTTMLIITYTMKAQKMMKLARRKVTLTRKKYFGCTGG